MTFLSKNSGLTTAKPNLPLLHANSTYLFQQSSKVFTVSLANPKQKLLSEKILSASLVYKKQGLNIIFDAKYRVVSHKSWDGKVLYFFLMLRCTLSHWGSMPLYSLRTLFKALILMIFIKKKKKSFAFYNNKQKLFFTSLHTAQS